MSNEQLQVLVEQLSIDVFAKPFSHNAHFNHRLRTTGGRYMLADHSIQINPAVLKVHGMEELIGVIKHELCHYHLHIEGKGYRHGDKDFKQLLKQTNSPRYCQPLIEKSRKSTSYYIYKCEACHLEYNRRKRVDISKYRCGKCRGQIKLMK